MQQAQGRAVLGPPAVDFDSVSKRFEAAHVLKSLTFSVRAGECFAVVGLNGAGKTTSIKALLDFIAIDSGNLQVFGRSHTETESRQRLAYLPEQFIPPQFFDRSRIPALD